MFGSYQKSHLRLEIEASETKIRESLLYPAQFKRWLWMQRFSNGMPERLTSDLEFTSWFGAIAICHHVAHVDQHSSYMLLSRGIDGFHQWSWGDGWIQSCLEGVTLLPLNLVNSVGLLQLKQFLAQP